MNSYTAGLPAVGCRREPGDGVKKAGACIQRRYHRRQVDGYIGLGGAWPMRASALHTTADKSAAIWDRGNASQIGVPIYRPQGFELAYSRRFTGGGIGVRTCPRFSARSAVRFVWNICENLYRNLRAFSRRAQMLLAWSARARASRH